MINSKNNLQLSALLTLEFALELTLEPGDSDMDWRLDDGVALDLLPPLAHHAGSSFAKYEADPRSLSLAELKIGSRFLEELLSPVVGVFGMTVISPPPPDRGLLAGLRSRLG